MTSEKAVHDAERGGSEGEKEQKLFGMGTSSNSRSFEVESWAFVPHQNYSLQLMQKIEPPLEGKTVPATFQEALSFFRIYTSTVEKSQRIPISIISINRFIWNSFLSSLKSLPLYYIQLFLSSYVPHKHLYIPAMVPLMFGYNLLMIVTTLSVFVFEAEMTIMLLHYAITGLIRNSPWDRCDTHIVSKNYYGYVLKCMESHDFRALLLTSPIQKIRVMDGRYLIMFRNRTITAAVPAPLQYYFDTFRYTINVTNVFKHFIIFATFVLIIGLFRTEIFKRRIWQIMHYSQWLLNLFYLGATLHIFVYGLETKMKTSKPIFRPANLAELYQSFDFDFFADIVNAPPVLHFVAARSNRQVKPAGDTCVLVFSNFVNYIIKGTSMYLMNKYCAHQYNIILLHETGSFNIFYLWPYYLSLVPCGDFLGFIFFLVNGFLEFICLAMMYHIGLECIQSAFPKLKWWVMLIITPPFALLMWIIMDNNPFRKAVMYLVIKSPIVLLEIAAIVFLYPIGRLEDDITFHTGSPPPKMLSVAIRIVPLFLGLKVYWNINHMYEVQISLDKKDNIHIGNQILGVTVVTLILGVFFVLIKNFCIKKQNWKALIRPEPTWGPKDHIQRQLRKQYDSREYIASKASRYLSRYLKSKLTSRMYRLDVCYEIDRNQRRSTVAPQVDSFRYDDEKKKDV